MNASKLSQVSILVLVESTLQVKDEEGTARKGSVSILVLVEATLQA